MTALLMETSTDARQQFRESASRYLVHCIEIASGANQFIKPGVRYERQKETSNTASETGDEISLLLEMLEEELPNLLMAFEWAQHLEERSNICTLADELSTFLNLRSHWSEWLMTAELAVKEAESTSDPKLVAIAFNNLAVIYRQLERFKDAEECSRKSLSLSQEIGDRYGEGLAYGNLAGAHFALGELQASQTEYGKAESIFIELDDLYEQSQSLMGIGMVLARSSRLEEASKKFESCLEIQREIGDKFGEAQTLNNLGIVLRMQGKVELAIQSFQTSVQIKRKIGDRQGIATVLNNLAIAYRQKGEFDLAIAAWKEALLLYSELNPAEMERIAGRLTKIKELRRSATNVSR
jgi:tetratricopeptide (TPR) repeat protein